MEDDEKDNLVTQYPDTSKFIKRFYGAREYLYDLKRWCVWVTEHEYEVASKIEPLMIRFEKVRNFRLSSKDEGTKKHAVRSYQFRDTNVTKRASLIFPQTTSENREYVPIGYLGPDSIISNAARVVYEADLWLFAVLSSKMHNLWLGAVSGRLETRIQYSNTISYNTFPVNKISNEEIKSLENSSKKILFARENHSEKTLAEMYDPNEMPADLREAHHQNDILVDRLYRQKPYTCDEERLADLFKLYEEMIAKEKE